MTPPSFRTQICPHQTWAHIALGFFSMCLWPPCGDRPLWCRSFIETAPAHTKVWGETQAVRVFKV